MVRLPSLQLEKRYQFSLLLINNLYMFRDMEEKRPCVSIWDCLYYWNGYWISTWLWSTEHSLWKMRKKSMRTISTWFSFMGELICATVSCQNTCKWFLSSFILINFFPFSLRSIKIRANVIGMEQQKVWNGKEQKDYLNDQLKKVVWNKYSYIYFILTFSKNY